MKTPPPLSPEVEALLAPHRRVLPLAPSVEARAIARAAATAAIGESAAPAVFRAPARPWWVLAAAACAVLVLGAAAYAARVWGIEPAALGAARVAPVRSPATESRVPAVAAPHVVTEEAATIAPRVTPSARHTAGKAAAIGPRVNALPTNAELQLLRLAHQDLTRRDFAGALSAVAEHTRRFRYGVLVEEREALRVKSLAGLGRNDDAQRAAAQFHARFPHSVLLSTLERMTEPAR
jgi:hypothetical protein